MRQRQQNSTVYPVTFFLVQSGDHITGLAGAMPIVTISKNGAAFASASGTIAEIGSGWYAWAANTSDRSALGELAVHVEATGADPVDFNLEIVPWDPFDANLGLNRLDAAVTSRASAVDYTAVRAAKLDNLDATISSRSTLTAANVWTNATRTLTAATNLTSTGAAIPLTPGGLVSSDVLAISGDSLAADELEKCLDGTGGVFTADISGDLTGTVFQVTTVASVTNGVTLVDGAIGATKFQANAITASALATDATLEIQSGLGTLANQTTIIAFVDELESRLTPVRAANLDNLDATISSRLASSAYTAPDNSSITQIESVLDGITSLAAWLRALIRADAADPTAKAEINVGGGTFDEAKHSLERVASLAELLEADRYIDTTVTPWAMVLTRKGSGGPGVGVELLRQELFTETGAGITSISNFVGRAVVGGGP
jgi:hypothetical protein